jgi:hypothetical protein
VHLTGGTAVNGGSNQSTFSFDNFGGTANKHSLIELAIPLSFFGANVLGGGESFSVQWAPSCGNDLLQVGYTYQPSAPGPTPVPEPSTLALMGLGGFRMAFRRWRRKAAV